MAGQVPQTAAELRDWLRGLKEETGASYADIARGVGEDERVVKRWMTGKQPSVPRGDSLLRLLDYFGVSINPAAPRATALSLMGEIRAVQVALRHLESGEGGEGRRTLPDIDRRLEELADQVAEVAKLLKPLVVQQQRPEGAGKPAKRKAAR